MFMQLITLLQTPRFARGWLPAMISPHKVFRKFVILKLACSNAFITNDLAIIGEGCLTRQWTASTYVWPSLPAGDSMRE